MERRSFLKSLLAFAAAAVVPVTAVAKIIEWGPKVAPLNGIITAFKGKLAIDTGCFYCPYIPLRIIDKDSTVVAEYPEYKMIVSPPDRGVPCIKSYIFPDKPIIPTKIAVFDDKELL